MTSIVMILFLRYANFNFRSDSYFFFLSWTTFTIKRHNKALMYSAFTCIKMVSCD